MAQEAESHELQAFEVPRVNVDWLGDDYTGKEKLTILKYLSLEDTLRKLGVQAFDSKTIDNIMIEPVRDWIREKWGNEFVYDLGKRNVPITFRASLALAILSRKIVDYLESLGSVEIYASRSIKDIYKKHDLPLPHGLTQIDYSSLPEDVQRELVIPIIENLGDAELVAHAGLLFPNGVNKQAMLLHDPALLFSMTEDNSDNLYFNGIGALEMQAEAARTCLRDYVKIKSLEAVVGKILAEQKPQEMKDESLDQELPKEEDKSEITRYTEVPFILYPQGTSFFDVFPYKEGETKDDVIKAFKRITRDGVYKTRGDHYDERIEVRLQEDGVLKLEYTFDGIGARDDAYAVNALTEQILPENPENIYDDYRCKVIWDIVDALRHELDKNSQALQNAKTRYKQVHFTVEKGFIEALTLRKHGVATPDEIKRDMRLAQEFVVIMKALFGIEARSTEIAVRSDVEYDPSSGELDYRILGALREHSRFQPDELMQLALGRNLDRDTIGDWMASTEGLVTKFMGVLVDNSVNYAVLGIEPGSNELQVKKAYRAIALKTHPDKILNLPPEDQASLIEIFKKAKEAYDNIAKRGTGGRNDSLLPTVYLGRISKLFEKDVPKDETP